MTIRITGVTQDEPVLGRGGRDEDDDEDDADDHDDSVGDPGVVAVPAAVDPARAAASDEGGGAAAHGRGRGDRECPDAFILDNGQVKLRRERLKHGNGRVYAISFTATDAAGGECSGTVLVCVPAKRHAGACVDDGQTVNSLGPCPAATQAESQREVVYSLGLNSVRTSGGLTTVEYSLPTNGDVMIAVFDIAGRRMGTLVNSRQTAGSHQASWNSSGLSHGIYYYRMQAADKTLTKSFYMK